MPPYRTYQDELHRQIGDALLILADDRRVAEVPGAYQAKAHKPRPSRVAGTRNDNHRGGGVRTHQLRAVNFKN